VESVNLWHNRLWTVELIFGPPATKASVGIFFVF